MERNFFLLFCNNFITDCKEIIVSVLSAFNGSAFLVHRQENIEGHCSALTDVKQTSASL